MPPILPAPVAAPEVPVTAAPGEIFPLRSIGEAVEAELRRSPVEPVPLPEPEPEPETLAAAPEPAPPETPQAMEKPGPEPEPESAATVTLGDLYLRQGHLAEAEGIFHEVLHREPGNAAAQAGLARIAASREEASAAKDLAAPGDRRSRKILLLNSYLQRIRRGSHPDVP
jgi:outer membrane biosynthesis protein TonB